MRTSLILISIYFLSSISYGQSLEGEWKGTFETHFFKFTNVINSSPIKLYFKLNSDSSYNVYSYSKGLDAKRRDTIIVCKVYYKMIGSDSIHLEETEIIKPQNAQSACLQKMKLKIVEKATEILLNGTWTSDSSECDQYGTITFRQKKEKKVIKKTNAQHRIGATAG